MNYDQLCLLPEDGNQYELFDGELVMTPSPSSHHQGIVGKLHALLLAHIEKTRAGRVYLAPLDTIFDEYTVLQPDILYVSRNRVPQVVKERIEGAPDLVVEVLSPSTFYKDLRRKMAVYAQFGVREYWIVDRDKQAIEVYGRQRKGLELRAQFSAKDTLESPLLPGFRLPVRRIFVE